MEQLQYYISKLSKPEKDKNMNIYKPVAPAVEGQHPTRPEQARNYPEANIERDNCGLATENSAEDAYNVRSTSKGEAQIKKKGHPGSLPNAQFTQ
jgi:hypothetical protein